MQITNTSSDIHVVFFGVKTFWRTRDMIEVHMGKHHSLSIIEIDFFEPTKNAKAPKMFVDSALIESRFDAEVVALEMAKSIEVLNRSKSEVNHENILSEVNDKMCVDFILNRLSSPLIKADGSMVFSFIRDEDVILSEEFMKEKNLIANETVFTPTATNLEDNKVANTSIEEANILVSAAVVIFLNIKEQERNEKPLNQSKATVLWQKKGFKRVSLINSVTKTKNQLKKVELLALSELEISKSKPIIVKLSTRSSFHLKRSIDELCVLEVDSLQSSEKDVVAKKLLLQPIVLVECPPILIPLAKIASIGLIAKLIPLVNLSDKLATVKHVVVAAQPRRYSCNAPLRSLTPLLAVRESRAWESEKNKLSNDSNIRKSKTCDGLLTVAPQQRIIAAKNPIKIY
eukprot:gene5284-7345_t